MDFIGEIRSDTGIDEAQWLELIKSDESLAPLQDSRTFPNPFKRDELITATPPDTTAMVLGDDRNDIGLISWAQDGSPVLIVEGSTRSFSEVRRVVDVIASVLGGQFFPYD